MEQRLIDANTILYDCDIEYGCDAICNCDNCSHRIVTEKAIKEISPVFTIPENPTNGDMIKALFKPYNIVIHEYYINIYLTEDDWINSGDCITFEKGWWNALYE